MVRCSPLIWQNLHLNSLLKSLLESTSSASSTTSSTETPRRPSEALSERHSEPPAPSQRRRHQTMVVDSRHLQTPPNTGRTYPDDTTLDHTANVEFDVVQCDCGTANRASGDDVSIEDDIAVFQENVVVQNGA
ncbi:unnamed protein product [Caenorhabditis nigoni]